MGSLQLLKEFFLLGRGELFLTFVDTANSFMVHPPTTASEHGENSCVMFIIIIFMSILYYFMLISYLCLYCFVLKCPKVY